MTKIQSLFSIFVLLLVVQCGSPEQSEDLTLYTGILTIKDFESREVLSREPFSVSSAYTVDYSTLEYHDFDWANVSKYAIRIIGDSPTETNWIFYTTKYENSDLINAIHLRSITGGGYYTGQTYGDFRIWVYTINSRAVGIYSIELTSGIYDGETLSIDTFTVDLAKNNLLFPDDEPTLKPSIYNQSEYGEYLYSLAFDNEYTKWSTWGNTNILKRPIFVAVRLGELFYGGNFQYPYLINLPEFFLPSRCHVDSIVIYRTKGLIE